MMSQIAMSTNQSLDAFRKIRACVSECQIETPMR